MHIRLKLCVCVSKNDQNDKNHYLSFIERIWMD